MTYKFQNVAVAGATGNMGPFVVSALLASGFTVTALSRSASDARIKLDPRCTVIEVDYKDLASLESALAGQNAVIVCGISMLPEQTNLIDAAIAAGVSRFFPADFAGDLSDARNRSLLINKDKVYVEEYLKARESQITHTSIRTGPLLDFVLSKGVTVNMKARMQLRFDDGSKRFSTTTMPTAARAVVAALKLGDASANRAFRIQDLTTTQNELLRWARELAPNVNWVVIPADTEEMAAEAEAALKLDPNDRTAIGKARAASVFGRDADASVFSVDDNKELGLGFMGEAEVKELLKRFLHVHPGDLVEQT